MTNSTSRWREPSNIIAFLSVVVSVVALIVAVISYRVSAKDHILLESEYISSRSLVLKGELLETSDALKLTPVDPAFHLQTVKFAFPDIIGGEQRVAFAPDFIMHLSGEILRIKDIIEAEVRIEAGFVKLKPESNVSFIVETSAAIKGKVERRRSIYTFDFGFSVHENDTARPVVTPLGISFVRELAPEEDLKATLAGLTK